MTLSSDKNIVVIGSLIIFVSKSHVECTVQKQELSLGCSPIFRFCMLGGLVIYSFTFFAWSSLIYFDRLFFIYLASLISDRISTRMSDIFWIIWQYFTISLVLMPLELLMPCHLFLLMCACRIYFFSHSFVKTFHWAPLSKMRM